MSKPGEKYAFYGGYQKQEPADVSRYMHSRLLWVLGAVALLIATQAIADDRALAAMTRL